MEELTKTLIEEVRNYKDDLKLLKEVPEIIQTGHLRDNIESSIEYNQQRINIFLQHFKMNNINKEQLIKLNYCFEMLNDLINEVY